MEIALIVGLAILLTFLTGSLTLLYSYYIYSRNRVFTKTKYSPLWIAVSGIVIIILLIGGIYFTIDLISWKTLAYATVYTGLSFACLIFTIFYFVCFLLMPKLTNKNKIDYKNLTNVNYQEKVNQLLARIGDLEKCKNELATKHKKYYQDMLIYYENILKRAKNEKISANEKWADIVTFNDAFTHKWCGKTNNYQLLLTYQFCALM